MSTITEKLKSLPSSPGVYMFKDKTGEILYVGKAGSLKDRVGSYFMGNTKARSLQANRPIELNIDQIHDIKIKKTDTVLEAYILEQELIKKIQPKYNVDGKDNKSFCYLVVTKEEFPRFAILRKTVLDNQKGQASDPSLRNIKYTKIYGPYVSKRNIEIALKILRKIFPYHNKTQHTERGCLDYQIGLCPGPYDRAISKADYARNIRGIRMMLEGRKNGLIKKLRKEMDDYAQKKEFERAAKVRNRIFALQHMQDVALISERKTLSGPLFVGKGGTIRIEGYDISNISGKYAVGSMVVFDNSDGEIRTNKTQYRKFKIKTVKGINDVAAMEEVLIRRLRNGWSRPNLIILDGGMGHLNMARRVLRNNRLDVPILAVAKGPDRKKLDLRNFGSIPEISLDIIEQVRNEAHRFAIRYHKNLRGRDLTRG